MLATKHADPQKQLAGLPPLLRKLCENISAHLAWPYNPEDAKRFVSDISKAAAGTNEDLSYVVWAFLAAELRYMPKQSAGIQHHIDIVIEGIELLASGEDWPGANKAAYDAKAASYVVEPAYRAAVYAV